MMSNSIPLPIQAASNKPAERSDAVANRQRILTAARQLFSEHDPAAVNMSDIVKATSVGRGTLYRHFSDKGALCLAVMDEEIVTFQGEVLAQLQQMTAVSASAMQKLDQFLDLLVHFADTHTLLLREVQQRTDHFDKKKVPLVHWQRLTVLGLLKIALANGEISPDSDIEYLADAILSPLNAQLFHYQRTVQGFSAERISAGIRRFVVCLKCG